MEITLQTTLVNATFISTYVEDESILVEVPKDELEKALSLAMRAALGFRQPTKAYGTWTRRFDAVSTEEYHRVLLKLKDFGY